MSVRIESSGKMICAEIRPKDERLLATGDSRITFAFYGCVVILAWIHGTDIDRPTVSVRGMRWCRTQEHVNWRGTGHACAVIRKLSVWLLTNLATVLKTRVWTGSEVRTDVRLSDVDELDMLHQPREAGQNVKSSANASRTRSAPPRGTQFPMSALMYHHG